jgi:hypothetical protein
MRKYDEKRSFVSDPRKSRRETIGCNDISYIEVEPSFAPIDRTLSLFLESRKSMRFTNSLQSTEILVLKLLTTV